MPPLGAAAPLHPLAFRRDPRQNLISLIKIYAYKSDNITLFKMCIFICSVPFGIFDRGDILFV